MVVILNLTPAHISINCKIILVFDFMARKKSLMVLVHGTLGNLMLTNETKEAIMGVCTRTLGQKGCVL